MPTEWPPVCAPSATWRMTTVATNRSITSLRSALFEVCAVHLREGREHSFCALVLEISGIYTIFLFSTEQQINSPNIDSSYELLNFLKPMLCSEELSSMSAGNSADPSESFTLAPKVRTCQKEGCRARLSQVTLDPHSFCVSCRGIDCDMSARCGECELG